MVDKTAPSSVREETEAQVRAQLATALARIEEVFGTRYAGCCLVVLLLDGEALTATTPSVAHRSWIPRRIVRWLLKRSLGKWFEAEHRRAGG